MVSTIEQGSERPLIFIYIQIQILITLHFTSPDSTIEHGSRRLLIFI
jgi:hypothetical protein